MNKEEEWQQIVAKKLTPSGKPKTIQIFRQFDQGANNKSAVKNTGYTLRMIQKYRIKWEEVQEKKERDAKMKKDIELVNNKKRKRSYSVNEENKDFPINNVKERIAERNIRGETQPREVIERKKLCYYVIKEAKEAIMAIIKEGNSAGKQEGIIPMEEIREGEKEILAQFEDECICPITQIVMLDPVIAADGRSYERAAITNWLAQHDTSPYNGLVLDHKLLIPNIHLKNIIQTMGNLNN